MAAIAALSLGAQPAQAQNMTTVSASNITDASGNKLPAGKVLFQPTDSKGNHIPIQIGGGGMIVDYQACALVVTGAITTQCPPNSGTFQVANPGATIPTGIYYQVTIQDAFGGVRTIPNVTWSGGTFNLDTFIPATGSVPVATASSIDHLQVGQLDVFRNLLLYGTCTGCLGGSVMVNNTLMTSPFAALNLANGAGIAVTDKGSGKAQFDFTALTTKGDLLGFGTVLARLSVGTDGQILIADSTQTLGLKWGAAPSGVTLRHNATNNSSQTDLNLQDGTGTTATNPSAGNVQVNVTYGSGANTAAVGNDSRITGAEQTANKGVASGYAGLDGAAHQLCSQEPALTGDVTSPAGSCAMTLPNVATAGTGLKTTINAKGQATAVATAATTDLSDNSVIVKNNQANTFGAFLQKFRAAANFQLGDPADFTKLVQFDLSGITTATTRTVTVANANSVTSIPIDCTGTGHLLKLDANGTFTCSADSGGGGGLTTSWATYGCGVTRTSSTVLTIFSGATSTQPCIVAISGIPYVFTGPITATISAGANQVFIYVAAESGDGAAVGAIAVADNGNTIVCSPTGAMGCTHSTGTGFPVDGSYRIASWTTANVSGQYDVSGGVIYSAMQNTTEVTNGTGINVTPGSDGRFTVALSTPVAVANGGTGDTTLPAHGVLLGEGTPAIGNVAAMAADTVLQGKGASADPAAVAVNNCGDGTHALSYSTSTHTFGCQAISSGSGTVTSFSAGNLSPLFATSVATATTTPALTFSLSNFAAQGVLAGPSAYGAAAAAPTVRVLAPQDMPAGTLSCAVLDTAICSSAVDANGRPNFLSGSGAAITVNGGTTPLTYFVGGVYQQINANISVTCATPAATTLMFLYAQADTTVANPAAGDLFCASNAPFTQKVAPTCPSPSPALSASNPSVWWNLAKNETDTCTANAGSYAKATQPMILLGVAVVTSTPTTTDVLAEPYLLNPSTRFKMFGSGAQGALSLTSGTTTKDGVQQYQSVMLNGATLNHTAPTTANNSTGLILISQTPIIIDNTSSLTAAGKGGTLVNGGTGAGGTGKTGGFFSGGGGGGGGGTGNAGGTGGGRIAFIGVTAIGGGGGGASGSGVGNAGTAADTGQGHPTFNNCLNVVMGIGGGGAAGGGDGTNGGGGGKEGGGAICVQAPAVLLASGSTFSCAGNNGAAGGAGNIGGGGGGGGGVCIINTSNLQIAGTVTAAGGTHGNAVGTGGNGGDGGAGIAQQNELW